MSPRKIHVRCSRCGRARQGHTWLHIPIVEPPEARQPAHGYCPECFDSVMREIQQAHAQADRTAASATPPAATAFALSMA